MMKSKVQWCRVEDKDKPSVLDLNQLEVKDQKLMSLLWRFFPFTFRLPDRNPVLLQVCRERKWKIFGEPGEGDNSNSWNLWWKTSSVKSQGGTKLKPWQTVNHIPNAANYCRKDVLARYLRRMCATYGTLYDFCPVSFNLPPDYSQLMTEHRKRKGSAVTNNRVIWIAKPVGKSQGKGIFIFERCSDLRYDDHYVVQEYIHRPLLINEYKWDLRLYVCITCNNPLTIYAYEEGIVRFATKKYCLSDLEDSFSHLTNTSINKQSPSYYKHKDTVGLGSKWTFSQLRNYFKKEGIHDYSLWQKIWAILVLTIIGDGQHICNSQWDGNGFQFLGFDVLVNQQMKPFLLEVNIHPGLGSDPSSSVDQEVKVPMLHDMFDLLGLPDGRTFPDFESAICSNLLQNELASKILQSLNESHHLRYGTIPSANPQTKTSFKFPDELLLDEFLANSNSSTEKKNESTTDTATAVETYDWLLLDANNNEVQNVRNSRNTSKPIKRVGKGRKPKLRSVNLTSKSSTTGGSGVFHSITVRFPVLPQQRGKIRIPTNGPGLTHLPPPWAQSPPTTCGKWTRIFPFDQVTTESSTFSTSKHSRDVITRVSHHLQLIRDLIHDQKNKEDAYYDGILQRKLTTKIWRPSLTNE